MVKQRVVETNEGIQNRLTVEIFDDFARSMRDKGWNNVDSFVKAGITKGKVLEIGSGPGYVGLEWLKRFPDATLIGYEISNEMIKVALKNAREYGLESRVSYFEGNCMRISFPENSFDAVFSNGSLHEWEEPIKVFNEINRVLRPGGIFCITDMRRDVNPLIKWFIYYRAKPKEIRPGFLTSFNASYTINEIKELLCQSELKNAFLSKEFFGLFISGNKLVLS